MRRLEIGPNKAKIPGFETLDIVPGPLVDHVGDASSPPFGDGTFDLVYSSHVIEHIEWDRVAATIKQWARILKPDGWLEVHTIDARRLMAALLHFDETGEWVGPNPTWREAQTGGDPYLWCVARLMNYPKGGNEYQKHRMLLTPNYLARCFTDAGLVDLTPLTREDARASRHSAFINLGLKGRKC